MLRKHMCTRENIINMLRGTCTCVLEQLSEFDYEFCCICFAMIACITVVYSKLHDFNFINVFVIFRFERL